MSELNSPMSPATPPHTPKQPYTHEWNGAVRDDPYQWLQDPTDPAVRAHLEAENTYSAAAMADTTELQKTLVAEIRSRVVETDTSAPTPIDDYWYYTRTVAGLDYPIYCRKRVSLEAAEEILLDQNELAKAHDHVDVVVFAVSPDHTKAAYSVDLTGDERPTLYVLDIATQTILEAGIERTGPSLEWAADSRSFWYTTANEQHRVDTVWWHELGTTHSDDAFVYHESDGRFVDVSLGRSKDEHFVFLLSASLTTTEAWYLQPAAPTEAPMCLEPRRAGHEYYPEHYDGYFYIVSNDGAPDFALWRTAVATPERAAWELVRAEVPGEPLREIEVFATHYCCYSEREGLLRAAVVPWEGADTWQADFPEVVYSAHSLHMPNYHSPTVRLYYSSPTTPPAVYDYDLATGTPTLVKATEVPGYESAAYVTERVYAPAADGTDIPVTLLRRCDASRPGPCVLEGYGSYGLSEPTGFRYGIISLLDRGYTLAIAHVRGGGERGKAWHDAGRLAQKQTTFADFIAVAEFLLVRGETTAAQLVATGGSAGGLLVGAVANQRPDLFQAIVADVPFVDVLTSMCDDTQLLTVTEYEEWGDPRDAADYATMAAYAPYDNVAAQAYPHLMVLAGWNDTRVQYWEAAKWVARLREQKTDGNLLLLKTEFGEGHGGATGRTGAWREAAYHYAFVLKAVATPRQDVTAAGSGAATEAQA